MGGSAAANPVARISGLEDGGAGVFLIRSVMCGWRANMYGRLPNMFDQVPNMIDQLRNMFDWLPNMLICRPDGFDHHPNM